MKALDSVQILDEDGVVVYSVKALSLSLGPLRGSGSQDIVDLNVRGFLTRVGSGKVKDGIRLITVEDEQKAK